MAFTRVASGICIANLHASTSDPFAVEELQMAGQAAIDWAGDSPIVFGGDLNVRPRDEEIYEELADDYGFEAPTAPDAIDHLLVRGLEIVDAPRRWPPAERELIEGGRRLRLSDHAPVEALFHLGVR
jgi:hypothetical protein